MIPGQFAEAIGLLDRSPAARREVALNSPAFWSTYYCGNGYAEHQERWLEEIIDLRVEARLTTLPGYDGPPEKRKLLLLGPRKHGKTVVAAAAAAQFVAEDRNIRILFVGESAAVARKRLAYVKQLLLKPQVQEDWCSDPDAGYGPLLPKRRNPLDNTKWDETAIRVLRSDAAVDATIEAVGLGGAVTGGHFDIIILDDPESDDSVQSPTQRAKNRQWLATTVNPMLNPGGLMLVIGTRKHHDDLYAHLKKDATFRLIEDPAIRSPAIGEWADRFTPVYEADEHGIDRLVRIELHGEWDVLWPEHRPAQWLLAERESIGSRNFNREFMHVVTDDGSALFKLAHLETAKQRGATIVLPGTDPSRPRGGPWPERLLVVQFWDPAFVVDKAKAEKGDSDFGVGICLGVDVRNRDRYILELDRHRGDSWTDKKLRVMRMYRRWAPPTGEFNQNIVDMVDNGWAYVVGMEANNGGALLGVTTGEDADIPLVLPWTGENKHSAYSGVPGLSNLLERGKMIFPSGNAATRETIDILAGELHQLGTAAHDDTVMALWGAELLARMALEQYERELEFRGVTRSSGEAA